STMAKPKTRCWEKTRSELQTLGRIKIDIMEKLALFNFRPDQNAPITILPIWYGVLLPFLGPAVFGGPFAALRVGTENESALSIFQKPFRNDQGVAAHRSTSISTRRGHKAQHTAIEA